MKRVFTPLFFMICLAGCVTHTLEADTPIRRDVRLAVVERAHYEEMQHHLLPEGLVVYMRRSPGTLRELYRQGMVQADGAYFNGHLLAALSLKYTITRDPAVLRLARRVWDAHHFLVTGSGYEGLVARSFGKRHPSDPGYVFRRDGSGDGLMGWLLGTAFFTRLIDDPRRRNEAASDLRAIVRHMKRHDLKVFEGPDKPTPYGNFRTPVIGFPVGHLALAMMGLANVAVALNPKDEDCLAFRRMLLKREFPEQSSSFYSWFPHHADNSMQYAGSLMLAWWFEDSEEHRKHYLEGAEAFWDRVYDWQMAAYALAYRFVGGSRRPKAMKDAISRLRNLPRRYHNFHDEGSHTRKRTGIVPLERRPSTSSFWTLNVFKELVRRDQPRDTVARCRIDFLFAYWLGRHLGAYAEDD